MRRFFLVSLAASLTCLGGSAPGGDAPWFPDLGGYHRTITTDSPDAQRWFDQGLTFYFGFNHEEAIRSFLQASKEDPSSAMAQWGMAISAGPNINNPVMEEAAVKAAYEGVQVALVLSKKKATPVERALIEALATRYAEKPPEDRKPLDEAYAKAMASVWKSHPEDVDVGALYAESLMDLRPWDLWTKDGKPHPGTLEIAVALETVLKKAPDHPGACHFYIHTMEASPEAGKALEPSNRLRTRVPGAGHLVHMPAHIDLRLGHYNDAVIANQKAVASDQAYMAHGGVQGFYTIYRAHNYHFLAFAAMFDGRREVALKAARDMTAELPTELVMAFADFLDAFTAVPIHVLVRFGLWEDVLKEPEPPADLVAARAFWRYGRTVALSSLGRVEEAAKEMDLLEEAIAAVPESRLIGNNTVLTTLEIGRRMADGELEYRRKNYDKAFALLREAVVLDEALKYDEPWGWMQPVSHALGALLLEQGLVDEAEAVYERDLVLHPGNGWALQGLAECQKRSGKKKEAEVTEAAFKKAWERADVTIKASCYCRKG